MEGSSCGTWSGCIVELAVEGTVEQGPVPRPKPRSNTGSAMGCEGKRNLDVSGKSPQNSTTMDIVSLVFFFHPPRAR